MGISRRRSPGLLLAAGSNLFLVMLISISFCTDMASATRWQDICTLGDTYIERDYKAPSSCDLCIIFCRDQCASFGTSILKRPCKYTSPTTDVNCQCCCSKRPSTSPQLPSTPSTVGQFTNGDIADICTFAPGQTYLPISHAKGTDCVLTPQCENKCQEQGLLSSGSQCVGAAIYGDPYTWIEQCCCRSPPPPPPSPSPPPPPPPSPPPPPPSPSPPPPPSPSPTPPPSPPPPPPSPSPPPPTPSPPPPIPPSPSPPPPPCPSPPTPGTCCGCCNSNINIQISVKSGCNAKVSTPASLSVASL
ncbi:hypothetical protein MKX03_028500 [Papaver bracteatum]|nr:hypothetical protein MKX03_028500 [Papaver bracteatum]